MESFATDLDQLATKADVLAVGTPRQIASHPLNRHRTHLRAGPSGRVA